VRLREVFPIIFAVDRDFAFTFSEENPRNSSFSAPYRIYDFHNLISNF
jgi:hypothetical protein